MTNLIRVVMTLIRDERGGLLVYAIFLILLISVFTVPLMQISATRAQTDKQDINQKIATNLAVTAVEEYLDYIKNCAMPCTDFTRYKDKYFLNGITETPRTISLTMSDGTPVTYSMYYQEVETNKYNVITRVVAGDTNLDNISNEKFSSMKEIVYTITGELVQKDLIDPSNPTPVTTESDKIFLDSGSTGNTGAITNSQQVPQLQTGLTAYLNSLSQEYEKKISDYKSKSVPCSDVGCINTTIQNSLSDTVVIKWNSKNKLSSYTNSTSKKVVLIFDSLGDFTGKNVDIITNVLDISNNFILENGDLMVSNSFEFKNQASISITSGSIFAHQIKPNKDNGIKITADNLIVKTIFDVKNNTDLNIKNQLIVGNIEVGNNAELACTSGDFFVASNFTVGNNTQLTAGGSVAIGGQVDIGSITVKVGGGQTILNPPSEAGGGSGGTSEVIWLPVRK